LQKLGNNNKPGRFRAVLIVLVIPAFLISFNAFSKTKESPPPQTWRLYDASYNRVWNAVVKTIAKDLKFGIRAADPKEGYLATWAKTQPEKGGKPKRRTRININVKKTAKGTLVTASCVIEEYIPPKKGKKALWMIMPSDNSCEATVLNAVGRRLEN